MKTYKTYQARNAVKAAQVTNHIKAAKKNGVSHLEAKAEAYRIYSIKAAVPSILMGLKAKSAGLLPLPVVNTITKKVSLAALPPLPKGDEKVNALPPLPAAAPKAFNYDLEV